jgi:hypothetical protein
MTALVHEFDRKLDASQDDADLSRPARHAATATLGVSAADLPLVVPSIGNDSQKNLGLLI